MPRRLLGLVLLAACGPGDRRGGPEPPVFVDLSAEIGFTDEVLGHFKRGRTCAPADFDGDGDLDLFVGGPQDPAVLMRATVAAEGEVRFEAEALSDYGITFWAAAALDVDQDGLPELFAGTGGNETEELDLFFANRGGELVLEPSAVPTAGPAGPFGDPVATATAGVRWGDFDLDGDLDLFVSTNIFDREDMDIAGTLVPDGLDRLLLNDGAGGFVDAGREAGLDLRQPGFNSTVWDYDNDGDLDLFTNALFGYNRVWRNELVETGALHFVDATMDLSPHEGVRMVDPLTKSFSTAAADLNNDGWEDLIIWHRGPAGPNHPMDWHPIWLNLGGRRFVEVGQLTGLSERWHDCEDDRLGVMGSQVADLDLDGFPDIFVGNGGPLGGCANQLWLSDGLEPLEVEGWGTVMVPRYRDASEAIDLPVEGAGVRYPYRTHGTCIADYDDDGRPELAFVNGGPGWAPDAVREPNRFFDVRSDHGFVAIRPVGDGVAVAREAIGTRVRARVRRRSDDAEWVVHQRLYGGQGFAASNGPDLILGLADADEIVELELTWPDGTTEALEAAPGDRLTVTR